MGHACAAIRRESRMRGRRTAAERPPNGETREVHLYSIYMASSVVL